MLMSREIILTCPVSMTNVPLPTVNAWLLSLQHLFHLWLQYLIRDLRPYHEPAGNELAQLMRPGWTLDLRAVCDQHLGIYRWVTAPMGVVIEIGTTPLQLRQAKLVMEMRRGRARRAISPYLRPRAGNVQCSA